MSAIAKLTPNQVGALHEMDMRDYLSVGWGGFSARTLRSLEDRGLARGDFQRVRFTITQAGRAALRAAEDRPPTVEELPAHVEAVTAP